MSKKPSAAGASKASALGATTSGVSRTTLAADADDAVELVAEPQLRGRGSLSARNSLSGPSSSSDHSNGHQSTGSTSGAAFPSKNTFTQPASRTLVEDGPAYGEKHIDEDHLRLLNEYEMDGLLEGRGAGATGYEPPPAGASKRSHGLLYYVQRYLLPRSRPGRTLLLIFAISFALLSLIKSTHPHLVPSPLHHFLPTSAATTAMLLHTSSPFVSPATSNSPLVGSGGTASLSQSSAWALTGIPGGVRGSPTLDDRLRMLLERPALMQWEMELLNRHECPFYTYDRNTYFFHEEKIQQWDGINSGDVMRYRNTLIAYLKELEDEGHDLLYRAPGMGLGGVKRGIIMAGGGGVILERLELSLTMLRKTLGCRLPIELFHYPDEMQDPELRAAFEQEFDVTLRQVDAKKFGGNWHIKNVAFLETEFTQFLYLDSDNIPLIDPTELFDSAEFRLGGSVFWPDLNKDHPDNPIWRVLGRVCSDMHWPAETGQVLFDKRGNGGLNQAVLHISNHMMSNPDMYSALVYGDKDTFRFAFYALGLPYQQAPRIMSSVGGHQSMNGEDTEYFCGQSIMHYGLTPWKKRNDPTYRPPPAFLHTILHKHRRHLQVDRLWSHLMRPRLDGVNEPTLVRTPYHFTGECFGVTQKGPDGLETTENSMRDGQGVVLESIEEVLGGPSDPTYLALMELAKKFVTIARD